MQNTEEIQNLSRKGKSFAKPFLQIAAILMAVLTAIIIGTILLVSWSLSGTHYQAFSDEKTQMMEQEFHIKVTADLTLEEYSKMGFHDDRKLNLSTQKELQAFLEENVLSAVTITETEQDSLYTKTKFKYAFGNETVYGTFIEFEGKNDITLFLPS